MVQDTGTTVDVFSAKARNKRIRRHVYYTSKDEEGGQELDIHHDDACNDKRRLEQ